MTSQCFTAGSIHDGQHRLKNRMLLVEDGVVSGNEPLRGIQATDLGPGMIVPGFVDLQVNGGDGVMFNDAPKLDTLERMAEAHQRLGTTALLPTLITDTPDVTRAAIDAAIKAVECGIPGIAGLHLEGPHLSVARKGAHDPALIRPMSDDDLQVLLDAAKRLPALIVTVAPETVGPDQIKAMAGAGITVSLGHSDADFATCAAAAGAGARSVTHLFNAMSQLGNREPGLVGAALQLGGLSAGLIADGIHVDPTSIGVAMRAFQGYDGIYLVTDSMAPAGSDITEFTLNGRRIERRDGRLTLENGTLAGADLDFATALKVMINKVGIDVNLAVEMATHRPARVIERQADLGGLIPGRLADFVHLDEGLNVTSVWRAGIQVA